MIITEKNQQQAYHSTTLKGIYKILKSGEIELSDAHKSDEDNNGYPYFLSTHNTTWNSVFGKPGLYVT